MAHYPTMTYRLEAGIQQAGGGETLLMDGELTLHGTTRPVTLTVEVNGFGPDPYGGTRAGFSASGEIDRTEFGITFNAPVPGSGGVMVSERIQIQIEAEAVLRQVDGLQPVHRDPLSDEYSSNLGDDIARCAGRQRDRQAVSPRRQRLGPSQ